MKKSEKSTTNQKIIKAANVPHSMRTTNTKLPARLCFGLEDRNKKQTQNANTKWRQNNIKNIPNISSHKSEYEIMCSCRPKIGLLGPKLDRCTSKNNKNKIKTQRET